jgi:hypothetical protein
MNAPFGKPIFVIARVIVARQTGSVIRTRNERARIRERESASTCVCVRMSRGARARQEKDN